MSLIIDKIPEEMWIKTWKVSFEIFADKFVDYMQDLDDIENVKNEMKNKSESFDYNLIRQKYV